MDVDVDVIGEREGEWVGRAVGGEWVGRAVGV